MFGINRTDTLERIVIGTNRRSAMKLRRTFMKVLMKDKKSSGVQLKYAYHPFRKRADYTIKGHPKTIAKCLRAFGKFVAKDEKEKKRLEMRSSRLTPIKTGKYYTMKSQKERTRIR